MVIFDGLYRFLGYPIPKDCGCATVEINGSPATIAPSEVFGNISPTVSPGFPLRIGTLLFSPDELELGRNLRQGQEGDDTRKLQEALKALGYYAGEITGIFDAATDAAVRRFQGDNNLGVDGIVGVNTVGAINDALRRLPVVRLTPEQRRQLIENLDRLNSMLERLQSRSRLTDAQRQRYEELERRKAALLLDLLEQEIDSAESLGESTAEEESRTPDPPEDREVFATIVTPDDKRRWNNEANIRDLARIIMSEASFGGPEAERAAVGYVVLNRMKRNEVNNVSDVQRGFSTAQEPNERMLEFARRLLSCQVADNSQGATHFYSPQSMPMEGDPPRGDTGGGLEQTTGVSRRNYVPSWAPGYTRVNVNGIEEKRFKFYRAPGTGRVR
ncbi:MAG: peptidoglycan-binding protein [Planctomycetes bacterium]|nr:peptidoglycan-binding protein [Planctomycetota bacterium]